MTIHMIQNYLSPFIIHVVHGWCHSIEWSYESWKSKISKFLHMIFFPIFFYLFFIFSCPKRAIKLNVSRVEYIGEKPQVSQKFLIMSLGHEHDFQQKMLRMSCSSIKLCFFFKIYKATSRLFVDDDVLFFALWTTMGLKNVAHRTSWYQRGGMIWLICNVYLFIQGSTLSCQINGFTHLLNFEDFAASCR